MTVDIVPSSIQSNDAELWLITPGFEDLPLLDESTDDTGHTFKIIAVPEEFTWGNPVPVDVAVQRWMTDGAVAVTQGHENREVFFRVVVSANTAADLAAGEAALTARSNQPALLKWVPPSGADEAPATVFKVWTWHLEHDFDSLGETWLERTYGVRMTAEPWVRSAEITDVSVLSSVSSVASVSIDTCSSASNWTGSPNTPTSSGGAVRESYTVTSADVSSGHGIFGLALTRNATVSGLSTTPYIVLDISTTGGLATLQASVDGVPMEKVAGLGNVSWWALPDSVTGFSELEVAALVSRSTAGAVTLAVNDVSASDTPGGTGTHMQLFRTITPGGSVKASGSIGIAAPTGDLSTVLLYTAPDGTGYVPAMRRYRTTGYTETLTPDATCVSGAQERIDSTGAAGATFTATIPADQLREATYAVVARMKCANAEVQHFYTTASLAGRTQYGSLSSSVTFAAADTFQWCALGLIALPPSPIPAESTQPTKINIAKDTLTAAHQVWLDELYLFDVTNGALSLIAPDPADTHSIVWVDAADVDTLHNRPAIYVGDASDRSDAMGVAYWQIKALGDHDLHPEGTLIFTVTEGVNDAAVTARYFQRWHTHAGA